MKIERHAKKADTFRERADNPCKRKRLTSPCNVCTLIEIVIYKQPVNSKAKVQDEIHNQNSYTEAAS